MAARPLPATAAAETDWLRPVSFGFVLAFASAPGQTFFISLSSGAIRREFGLEHLELSALYTGATVLSALLMLKLGRLADRPRLVATTLWTLASLGVACLLMASAGHVVVLAVAFIMLRLLGQGLLSHLAMTGLGRYFASARGRALAVATLGYPCAEGLLPSAVAWGLTSTSWRMVWLTTGAVVLTLLLPLVGRLGRGCFEGPRRAPPTVETDAAHFRATAGRAGRGATRGEVLRDPRFYLALPAVLLPAFVLTGVFFHQVHLAEVRGWSLTQLAQLYPGYAVAATLASLGAGWLVDRASAWTLLIVSLMPLAGGMAALTMSETILGGAAFYVLAGVTAGWASVLQGTLWPEQYGTEWLGDIRAVAVTGLILSSSAAPLVVGASLDAGLVLDDFLKVMMTVVISALLALVIGSRVLPLAQRFGSNG